jgi:hypothetical protein
MSRAEPTIKPFRSFDGHRGGFAAADAQRGHTFLEVALFQRAEQRDDVARPTRRSGGRARRRRTLTISCGRRNSSIAAIVTAAKASLTPKGARPGVPTDFGTF